jgi:hypothetical protein
VSVVTGFVLCCGSSEDDCIARVRDWFRRRSRDLRDLPLDVASHAGGDKHPQMAILAAGINHFEWLHTEVAAFVLSLPWECPENVVLVLQPESGRTQIYRPLPSAAPLGAFVQMFRGSSDVRDRIDLCDAAGHAFGPIDPGRDATFGAAVQCVCGAGARAGSWECRRCHRRYAGRPRCAAVCPVASGSEQCIPCSPDE